MDQGGNHILQNIEVGSIYKLRVVNGVHYLH